MKKNQNGFGAIEGLLILVIIGLVSFVGWYVYHAKNNTDATLNSAANTKVATVPTGFQLPKNWDWYTSSKYGFKFAYPQAWGQPVVSISQGDVGTNFDFNFYPAPAYTGAMAYNSRTPVNLLFQTADYSTKNCNDSGCQTATASPTKASIQGILTSIANGSYNAQTNGTLLSHDSTSYDIVSTQLPNGGDTTDMLVENKTVDLTKTNVSGVYISYGIVNAPTTCKSDALSDSSQQLCINQTDVSTISQLADSIATD